MKTVFQIAGFAVAASLLAGVVVAQTRGEATTGQRVSVELSARAQTPASMIVAESDVSPTNSAAQPAPARKVRVIVPSPYLQ
jgi:hypothetical protein